MSKRNQKTLGIWGPNGTRVVASEAMWREPVKWNQDAEPESLPIERPRVFCASLADVFEDWQGTVRKSNGDILMQDRGGGMESAATLGDVRARLVKLWDATPNLDWLVLTKRPENIRRMVHDHWTEKVAGHVSQNEGDGRRWKKRENVWLGTSIACQEDADRNIPEILKCRGLAAKLFLSIEPLIGPVDLSEWLYTMKMEHDGDGNIQEVPCRPDINWVIAGGESGPNAWPCNIAWIRDIVRQCKDAGVSCFVKQLGANPVTTIPSMVVGGATNGQGPNGRVPDMTGQLKLSDPKGGDMNEWPEDIRVREIPT